MGAIASIHGSDEFTGGGGTVPKFSIITVCLNEEGTIRRTCESICSQSFDAFEWIVIDGNSTDNTLKVLAEYESRISCLISEPDAGIYDAMNKGILKAKGEYLLFLNAGDYLIDSGVLKDVSLLPNMDILYGDLLCVDENGNKFIKKFSDNLSRNFLLRNMMPHQASFFRRELFARLGNYDVSFRIAGDYDLFVRYLYVEKVSSVHLPRVLAVFGTNGISSSPFQRVRRKIENHQIRKRYFPWWCYGLDGLKMEIRFHIYRNATKE